MLGPLEEVLGKQAENVMPDNRRLVEVAHRNGLRLLKLVNSLLDFSRIEAGRLQARYQPTDIAAFTAELASCFRSATDRAGLQLVIDTPSLEKPVYLDRDLWEKVIFNLLSNAFKFTFEGEISVEVRLSADGETVATTVRDTGTGIASDALPRLFERFHRVEGARGRSFEGSGIGLALVQELVKLHGGEVCAESELGSGSSFTVTIPLGSAHLPPDRLAHAGSPHTSGTQSAAFLQEILHWLPAVDDPEGFASAISNEQEIRLVPVVAAGFKGRRILLADDNADMRSYVERLLSSHGFVVEAVVDGAAALAAARRELPDLILSDVMMPNLDGFGMLRELRADASLRDTPVILLSARAGEEAKIEGLEAGADDYVTKPFSARELVARVSAALNIAHIRRQAEVALHEETRTLETLNRIGTAIASELDLERLVQMVTDASVELTGAEFGAFFYNVIDDKDEHYTLYSISGVERSAFDRFPMPRNTAVFEPTFKGEGIVRSDDILADSRYGKNAPYHGMPEGHLPVRSYLAVPVTSRSGEVIGGLFFGHPQPSRSASGMNGLWSVSRRKQQSRWTMPGCTSRRSGRSKSAATPKPCCGKQKPHFVKPASASSLRWMPAPLLAPGFGIFRTINSRPTNGSREHLGSISSFAS